MCACVWLFQENQRAADDAKQAVIDALCARVAGGAPRFAEQDICCLTHDMKPEDRQKVFDQFCFDKKPACKVLVATNVLARGVDVPNVCEFCRCCCMVVSSSRKGV